MSFVISYYSAVLNYVGKANKMGLRERGFVNHSSFINGRREVVFAKNNSQLCNSAQKSKVELQINGHYKKRGTLINS